MNWLRKHQQGVAIVLAGLLGVAVFVWLYGVRVIDPTNTDWILHEGGDLAQHYFGWAFYRNAQWTFPVGMMDTLGYPYPTSVLYLDSIPLFAVLFKWLSPILPETFQYLGLWGLLCYTLQGALAAAICAKYTRSGAQTVLSSLLFVIAPILLYRMFYHTALASHWMLLLGLLLVVRRDALSQRPVLALALWALMGLLSAGIHQYYLLFGDAFCFAYSLFEVLGKKRLSGLLPCIVFIVFGLLGDCVLGAFSVDVEVAAGGLGEYSLNLNALVNPQWNSKILRHLPLRPGQMEGYAYLGFGVLVLFGIALVTLLVDYQTRPEGVPGFTAELRRGWVSVVIYAGLCLGLLILALSPVITLGDNVLFELKLPESILRLWAIFRSSGRLIWPVCYLITLAGVAACAAKQPRRLGIIVLVLCVGLQIYDSSAYMRDIRERYHDVQYTSPLTMAYWDDIGSGGTIKHMVTSDSIGIENFQYPLAEVAAKYKWTLNRFYFARAVSGIYGTFNETLNSPSDDTIVVVQADEAELVAGSKFPYLYEFDGLVVALSQPGPESLPTFDSRTLMQEIRVIGDGQNIDNGEDIDGVRYIHPGGISYGPYAFMAAGEYRITIRGTNLDLAAFDCVSDYGDTHYELIDLRAFNGWAQYRVRLTSPANGMEMRVFNHSSTETITITDFDVTW